MIYNNVAEYLSNCSNEIRLNRLYEIRNKIECSILNNVTKGIEEYRVDSGQSILSITYSNITDLKNLLAFIENRINDAEQKKTGRIFILKNP